MHFFALFMLCLASVGALGEHHVARSKRTRQCSRSGFASLSAAHFKYCMNAEKCTEQAKNACPTCFAFDITKSKSGACWECDPSKQDCEKGVCDGGLCISECKADSDCESGFICESNRCLAQCFDNEDCPGTKKCFSDGRCGKSCSSNNGLPSDAKCKGFQNCEAVGPKEYRCAHA